MCPIARTLDRVGEWWSMLILRDAYQGFTRFEQFQVSLGIAPNILTRRLNALTEAGFFEKKAYSRRPLRYEYVLTKKGWDFWGVLAMLAEYGNRHFAEAGVASRLVDARTGKSLDAVVVDKRSGDVLGPQNVGFAIGPGADAVTKLRARYLETRRQGREGRDEWDAYAAAQKASKKRRSARRS